jgi:hypothetical protein
MKFTAPLRILTVALVCVVALIALVINESRARASGTEVLLAIEAVDPRALLSGHYVIFNPTQTLAPGAPCPAGADTPGWIALNRDGDVHRVSGGAATREEASRLGELTVEGSFFCNIVEPIEGQAPIQGWVRADLGVDRFHINQSEAERIERVLREAQPGETRAFAIVSIGRDGRARLIGLQIDDERLELSWT